MAKPRLKKIILGYMGFVVKRLKLCKLKKNSGTKKLSQKQTQELHQRQNLNQELDLVSE